MSRIFMLVLAALASLAVAASALGSASHSSNKPSLRVQPGAIRPGAVVHVWGKAHACAAGSRLTAFSFAFPESKSGAGALSGKVHANHRFSIRQYSRGNLLAGRYPVTASCGHVRLGITAYVRVK